MVGKFVDLTGRRFGRLIVIERTAERGKGAKWLCMCDCGNYHVAASYLLTSGQTTSCGCYHREVVKKRHTKHGGRHTKLYAVYMTMKARCYNPNNRDYADYGGRGINVYSEWLDKDTGFINFREWAIQTSYREGLEIERIDNDKDYEPSNCCWATRTDQNNNKRSNHYLEHEGRIQSIAQWADEVGMKKSTLYARINVYNWNVEKALTTPVKN